MHVHGRFDDLAKEAAAKPTTSTRTSCIPGDVKCGGIANVVRVLFLSNECGLNPCKPNNPFSAINILYIYIHIYRI